MSNEHTLALRSLTNRVASDKGFADSPITPSDFNCWLKLIFLNIFTLERPLAALTPTTLKLLVEHYVPPVWRQTFSEATLPLTEPLPYWMTLSVVETTQLELLVWSYLSWTH